MDRIAFGTGGLRGIMGDDPGCINGEVIQRVSHGLAKVILSGDAPKSVGIAFDTRHNSAEFAQVACDTFSAFGIEVYVFDKPMPTPTLSFAIRHLKLGWGVCITASHNPQEYNGYKVYDKHGVQVTDCPAAEITDSINSVGAGEGVPSVRRELVKCFDGEVAEAYFEQIVSFVIAGSPCHTDWIRNPMNNAYSPGDCGSEATMTSKDVTRNLTTNPYTLVYSALYGAGANAVPMVLERLGFSLVCLQQEPDGAFGGLKTPNPEEPVVYEMAIAKATETGAKLILATDPDCDRVGVMVKTENGYELLNGNQVGALLIDYLAQTRGVSKGDNAALCENAASCGVVISTIVSGQLGELVAKEHGLEFVRLLTGFKYIGEYIVNLSEDKQFFFGYEESYGYLAGDGAKDKDAVIASALIVKMAEFYSAKGMTLLERWTELSEKHGYCLEVLHNISMPQSEQKVVMSRLRENISNLDTKMSIDAANSLDSVTRSEDYIHGVHGLPKADVLKLYFADCNGLPGTEAWAAVRPSGTEPKLKLYVGVCAKTYEAAKEALDAMLNEIEMWIAAPSADGSQ
jgi:phosphoglucomutase